MKGFYRFLLPLVLLSVCLFAFPTRSVAEEYVYAGQWGSYGSGEGQFVNAYNLALDNSNIIYVTDSQNYRIQKFDASGNYLSGWGAWGFYDGQFQQPWGIDIDSAGNVFIADVGNSRCQKLTPAGNFINKWGSYGSEDGKFKVNKGIAVDPQGNIYVADTGNNRVQKFSDSAVGASGINFVNKWGSAGSGDGQFLGPSGIALDDSGNVYVADTGNNRIQKFDGNGTYMAKWGGAGTGDGQFKNPNGIAVDSAGNVYVADSGNNRIQKFNSNGNFITKWGSYGSGNGMLSSPSGVAVDPSGTVYVADTMNRRIQKFVLAVAATTTTMVFPTTLPPVTSYNLILGVQGGTANKAIFYPPTSGTISPNPAAAFYPVRVLDKNGAMIVNTATDYLGMAKLNGVHVGDKVQISYYRLKSSETLPPELWATTKYFQFILPLSPVKGALATLTPPPTSIISPIIKPTTTTLPIKPIL